MRGRKGMPSRCRRGQRREKQARAGARSPYPWRSAPAPDFVALVSLFPSFASFVTVPVGGRPSIDFAATRELTHVLPLHDQDLNCFRLLAPRRDDTAKSLARQHSSAEASSYTKTLFRMRWIHTHGVSFSLWFW